MGVVETARLSLTRPGLQDAEELFALLSDPAMLPFTRWLSLRDVDAMRAVIDVWSTEWDEADGQLGIWVVRQIGQSEIIGCAGCRLFGGIAWEIANAFAISAQGRGYATEVSTEAIGRARALRPELPIFGVAVSSSHSPAVGKKTGLQTVYFGPDVSDPDSGESLQIDADRPMSDEQVATVLRRLTAAVRMRGGGRSAGSGTEV